MEAISPAVRCETHDCAAYCNEAVKLALWPFSGPSIVISDSIPIEKIYNQRMASALTSQFDAISVAYAVVAAVALVQLVRIQIRVPEYGWTTQKMFHLLNLVVCLFRMVVCALRLPISQLENLALQSVLLDLPGLLFATTYALLVLFWAEIYHQARTMPTGNLRPAFVVTNLLLYMCQGGIWLFMAMTGSAYVQLAHRISDAFAGIIALLAAVGFGLYGGRLFLMLRSFPIDSRGRRKKIHEVGFVTSICSTCFLVRSAMDFFSSLDPEHGSMYPMSHISVNIVYYTVSELLPSAFVLYILRKLPPKRSPQGYQAIPAT